MKTAAIALALYATTAAAAEPTECQMKSAYVEFVVSSMQSGISESRIPDLYGKRLSADWKATTRHVIYSDPQLSQTDPMRAAEQVYHACQQDTKASAERWRGTFSMPSSH